MGDMTTAPATWTADVAGVIATLALICAMPEALGGRTVDDVWADGSEQVVDSAGNVVTTVRFKSRRHNP